MKKSAVSHNSTQCCFKLTFLPKSISVFLNILNSWQSFNYFKEENYYKTHRCLVFGQCTKKTTSFQIFSAT